MLRSRYIIKNCNSYGCCCLSDGTLKAISNAAVSMVSESPAKASKTLYKGAGDLKKVGNRIVAIVSINTSKR